MQVFSFPPQGASSSLIYKIFFIDVIILLIDSK